MIKGIGIDIIEIERIRKALNKNESFLRRIFTSREIEIFHSCNYAPQTVAGFFSAKEAVSKALGTGIRDMKWMDIEILKDQMGKPYVELHNNAINVAEIMGVSKILISISHSKENAISQAVAI